MSVSVWVSVLWNYSLSDVRMYRRVGRVVIGVRIIVGVGVVEFQLYSTQATAQLS